MEYNQFRKKYDFMFNAILKVPLFNNAYERILQNGWHYVIYDRLFFNRQFDYEKEHPTKQMRDSRVYFNNNADLINECVSYLSDEKSKRVYRGIIAFRCTKDRERFPEHEVYNQYFPEDIIKLSNNEVFVDCGACRGDTYRRFRREVNGKYRRVVCFETDEKNISYLLNSAKNDKRLRVIPKGVWSEEGCLHFEQMGTKGTGRIVEAKQDNELKKVPTVPIDSLEICSDATFIKMDIEGSEWNALHGASKTIRSNHPKLAICIYHSDKDYIRLLLYIHQLNPNYRLYVRHHSTNTSETVLYAIDG